MEKKANKFLVPVLILVLVIAAIAVYFVLQPGQQPEDAVGEDPAVEDPAVEEPAVQEPEVPLAFYEMYDTVTDSSDFPDWTGNQLSLEAWYTHGPNQAVRPISENDVVTPEISRVTGIELDSETAFDNGGHTVDVKLGMLAAAEDWPHIAFVAGGDFGQFADLIAAGKVHDLTEAIANYAPNLAKNMPFDIFPDAKRVATANHLSDRLHAFPIQLGAPERAIRLLDPEFVSPFPRTAVDDPGGVWVRDDILQMLYPEAKTMDQIEELYMQQGYFTHEQIFDVPLRSTEDFIAFLYDIQELIRERNLTENGLPIQVSYALGGGDNWNLMGMLFPFINRMPGNNNYFTYFDRNTDRLEFTFKQDFFRDGIRRFSALVRDGVLDPASLLYDRPTHLNLVNTGQYAVVYRWDTPDPAILAEAGKTFRFRRVFIDSPVQTDRFIAPTGGVPAHIGVMVFRDRVTDEELPQIIRYLDYMVSDVGQKMVTWGPRDAGLFEEADGRRTFIDEGLRAAMVYNEDNGRAINYNLYNPHLVSSGQGIGFAWPYHFTLMWDGGRFAPRYTYERVRHPGEAGGWFNPGTLPGLAYDDNATPLNLQHHIWNFFGVVPAADEFWTGRQAFETALTRTLTAEDDAHFDRLWEEFINIAVDVGATDDLMQQMNDLFSERNEGLLD